MLTVLLNSEREFSAFDLLEITAFEVIHHHVLRLGSLALAAAGALLQTVGFTPAVLYSGLHHPNEAPDPVGLLAVSFAELLKMLQQFGRSFTAILDLVFDFVEESVKLTIDLK